jgi:hypothetical protein
VSKRLSFTDSDREVVEHPVALVAFTLDPVTGSVLEETGCTGVDGVWMNGVVRKYVAARHEKHERYSEASPK